MDNNNGGVNTILIVILLLLVVGGLVWFFTRGAPSADNPNENSEFNVDVSLPEEITNGGGDQNGEDN